MLHRFACREPTLFRRNGATSKAAMRSAPIWRHWRLFAPAQAMHIDRQRLESCWVEPARPGGHHRSAPCAHALRHGLPAFAIEPNGIRQIRGTLLGFALAVGAMAGGALIGEHFLPPGDRALVLRLTR